MNAALIIMFCIIIVLIILFIVLSATSMKAWSEERENIIIQNTDLCTRPLDQLVIVDPTQNICCYNNAQLTGAYFIETNVNGQTLGMSVIPISTYYINVCREYCSVGYTVNSDGTLQCEGEGPLGPQTVTANNCVELIQPVFPDGTPCRGSAMPVGVLGINPMYAFHMDTNLGIAQCPSLGPCP